MSLQYSLSVLLHSSGTLPLRLRLLNYCHRQYKKSVNRLLTLPFPLYIAGLHTRSQWLMYHRRKRWFSGLHIMPHCNQSFEMRPIHHAVDVMKSAAEVLNSGQGLILTCDQPLCVFTKQIQYSWSFTVRIGNIVVLLCLVASKLISKCLEISLENTCWIGVLIH